MLDQENSALRSSLGNARLLVHVAFHHVPARAAFLQKVLTGFAEYKLGRLLVVVDSNTEDARDFVKEAWVGERGTVRVDVHKNLAHPFDLTWAHRAHMGRAIDEWDYFMYLEDDIWVPWPAFEAWAQDSFDLDRHGYIRGFLRVERDLGGRTVSTDWFAPCVRPRRIQINGRSYIRPDAFYHACWIYSQSRMRQFVATRAWASGMHRLSTVKRAHRGVAANIYTREYSAFGMSCATPGRPRVLLPIGADGCVPQSAWLWHLPNNYGNDPTAPGGKLTPDELVIGAPIDPGTLGAVTRSAQELAAESWRWLIFALGMDDMPTRVVDGLRNVRRRLKRVLDG